MAYFVTKLIFFRTVKKKLMLGINSVVKCSNWDYENPNDFLFMSWFYLHGDAETQSEFDCVEANLHTFRKALKNHIFLAQLLNKDGSKQDVLVIPFLKEKRMTGLICLCTDTLSIRHALMEYDSEYSKDTCIEETEKKYIYDNYPEIQNIIREYNYKH